MGRPRRLELIPATGDVPIAWAAARMGFVDEQTGRPQVEEFTAALPGLFDRGFPRPDPSTGRFDMDAIMTWRRSRFPEFFGLTPAPAARDARTVVGERLARMSK